MSVSGTSYLLNSSFLDNTSGDGGGPAISNGGVISLMIGLYFSGNGYHCPSDAFMDLNEVGFAVKLWLDLPIGGRIEAFHLKDGKCKKKNA